MESSGDGAGGVTLHEMIRHNLSDEGPFELKCQGREGATLENYQGKRVPVRHTSSNDFFLLQTQNIKGIQDCVDGI